MAKIQIALLECPNGHKVRCIGINNTRVTGFKCCGSWQTMQTWTVDADDLIETIRSADFEAMREKGRQNRAKVAA